MDCNDGSPLWRHGQTKQCCGTKGWSTNGVQRCGSAARLTTCSSLMDSSVSGSAPSAVNALAVACMCAGKQGAAHVGACVHVGWWVFWLRSGACMCVGMRDCVTGRTHMCTRGRVETRGWVNEGGRMHAGPNHRL